MASGKPLKKKELGTPEKKFLYLVLRDVSYRGHYYRKGENAEMTATDDNRPPYHFWPLDNGPVDPWPEKGPYKKPGSLPEPPVEDEQPETLSGAQTKIGRPMRGKQTYKKT